MTTEIKSFSQALSVLESHGYRLDGGPPQWTVWRNGEYVAHYGKRDAITRARELALRDANLSDCNAVNRDTVV